jgi:hypothetical protein
MTLKKNILALRQKKAIVQKGGGDKAIEKQVAMGKMTSPRSYSGFVGRRFVSRI